ncbi:MAG: S24 family peptidase, partial [Alcanivoracaceae bacterium]|nr:S24 family peptidase [Alcanivoracaceae bacterium]
DLIAVRKTNMARSGQIVVARLDEDVTVKTLKIEKSAIFLMPANDAYEPIAVAPDQLMIEGIVVGLIRDVG